MKASQPPRRKPDQPRMCFVIGPIGDQYAAHGSPEREAYEHHLGIFEQVIAPACEKYEIAVVRADGIAHAGDINEQVCRHVIESDLVIADVSGGNPNVMYELGLRHITGRATIHIGEAGQLPFDIASIRTIRYQRARSHLAGARREIESALEAGIRDGFELLTPARVVRALQTVDRQSLPNRGEEGEDEDDPTDENPSGLLDDFAAIEDGLEEMTAHMGALTKVIETIGTLSDQSNIEMLDLVQANAPARVRLAAVVRYAESLSALAGEMNTIAGAFAERMVTMDSGVRAVLGLIEVMPPDERDEAAGELLGWLIALNESAQAGLAQIISLGASASDLVHVSRHLRDPVKDISTAVTRMISAITCMGEWAGKARDLAQDTQDPTG
ncbi:hypothetical protein [Streptomyces murinus]|uniref:hypothetical protein n=1 Tax=Streptomyces murinus TaxID=33900 RepID=UPI0018F64AAF|nr:hypothetical protein [Streptomyces murinus]